MSSEFIAGRNPVIEALKSGRDINKIWIAEGSQKGSMGQITTLAKEKKVLVQFVPKQKIEGMVRENHQGVVAQVAAYQYAEMDELYRRAEQSGEASILPHAG